jgi:arylmalonate decarboxylase
VSKAGGRVGLIKPTDRPGSRSVDNLIKLLPPSVELIQTALNITTGSMAELEQALIDYECKVAEMAERGVDLIHPAGVPPLLLGYQGERELVEKWERLYKTPVFTNGMSQVNALNVFGAKRIVGASYFKGSVNRSFGDYLAQAGFEVLAMEGMDVDFQKVLTLDPTEIMQFVERLVDQFKPVDAIYLLGSAWPTLDMLESMEAKFGVPVVHHITCQSWEMQKRLNLQCPVQGYGRLIGEMP